MQVPSLEYAHSLFCFSRMSRLLSTKRNSESGFYLFVNLEIPYLKNSSKHVFLRDFDTWKLGKVEFWMRFIEVV